MAITLTTPVTGSPQTGLTSPTYTIVSDLAPDTNSKQWVVTALGGTQTGVTVHGSTSPFFFTVKRPKTFKLVGVVNPTTGTLKQVPSNVWKFITGKSCTILAGQPVGKCLITTTISVPAGSDAVDPANIRAALSFHLGSLSQQSAGCGDSIVTGLL